MGISPSEKHQEKIIQTSGQTSINQSFIEPFEDCKVSIKELKKRMDKGQGLPIKDSLGTLIGCILATPMDEKSEVIAWLAYRT